jgi:hypothetical protein
VAGIASARSSGMAGFCAVDVNVPGLHDLERNVIADLAFLGQSYQPLAGFARVILHDRLENFVVEQETVKAIGALKDDFALT